MNNDSESRKEMKPSSSCSRDLQNTKSKSSSSSSSFNNNNNKLNINNSGIFLMSFDGKQSPPPPTGVSNQQQITAAGNGNRDGCKQEEMTLEDFLAKAAAGASTTVFEDVKIPIEQEQEQEQGRMFTFGKRPAPPSSLLLDKAAQQRQKRMIKNRESAARSRERKQAYQSQLESVALKLEQDNRTLSLANINHSRTRYKQLMDNIIPVTDKPRPPTTRYLLRKVRSMEW